MKFEEVETEPREPGNHPRLLVQDCGCGCSDCEAFVIAMLKPFIKPLADSEELVSMVYFPVEQAQALVDKIRELAKLKGVHVR